MLHVSTLRCQFDPVEDRLILSCQTREDQPIQLHLTRRLTRRLLKALGTTLIGSSQTVAQSPASFRGEVMWMEHMGALADTQAASEKAADALNPGASPAPVHSEQTPNNTSTPPAVTPWLITQVDLTPATDHFLLTLHDPDGHSVCFPARRNETHRLVATLKHWAQQAQWDIEAEIDWLNAASAPSQSARARPKS